LLAKSLTFQYSYSNGRKSIDGMPSVLSSIPSFVEPFFLTPSASVFLHCTDVHVRNVQLE
jgi:hypothetical protein